MKDKIKYDYPDYVGLPYKGSINTAKLLGFGKKRVLVYYILTSKKITIEDANTTFADLFELWRNHLMILITENEIRYTVVDQSDVPNSVLITSLQNDLFLAGKDAKLYTILLEDGGTFLSKIATVII